MKVAIAGFEKTGKTMLFNAVTGLNAEISAGQTPVSSVHEGVATVIDQRIGLLSGIFNPKKTTYATIEYLDLPGLVRNEPARNQKILDLLREQDLIIHVCRAFDDTLTPHPFDTTDIRRDMRTFESELVLMDQMFIEKRVEKIESNLKRGLKENPAELDVLSAMKTHLETEQPLRTLPLSADQQRLLMAYKFISTKPIIHVVNMGEDAAAETVATVLACAAECTPESRSAVISLCAKVEKEISEFPAGERAEFLMALGIEEPAANLLVRSSYALLGYISFFTVGEDEVRAWTIRNGMTAKEAGGRIHSDIEKGFIRAEVVSYDAFMEHKSLKVVKEKGLFRLEGKTYVVQDGDIMNFRFNV